VWEELFLTSGFDPSELAKTAIVPGQRTRPSSLANRC